MPERSRDGSSDKQRPLFTESVAPGVWRRHDGFPIGSVEPGEISVSNRRHKSFSCNLSFRSDQRGG